MVAGNRIMLARDHLSFFDACVILLVVSFWVDECWNNSQAAALFFSVVKAVLFHDGFIAGSSRSVKRG